MIVAIGLGKDINKNKVILLEEIQGKREKISACGSSRRRFDIWKIFRCRYTEVPSEF